MASPVGGRFKFQTGTTTLVNNVNLGLTKTGATAPVPGSVKGALNIEVYTGTPSVGLKTGFTQRVSVSDTVKGDTQPHLIGKFPNELLTGRRLTLFGGNYRVTDTNTVTGNTALIIAGSGQQTVVGAARDTLLGGTGSGQLLSATKGHESVIGGTRLYSVTGGVSDTIKGNAGATSITAGHISATASGEQVQIGKAGKYTVSAGASDTITSATGSGNATITAGTSNRINLNGNTGTVSVVGKQNDTIIAGRGNETIRGIAGDRIGVGSGATVGGNLRFIHSSTTLTGGVHFGTNDTVNSATYDTVTTGVATRSNAPGSSFANVTVTNFKVGTDSLFYHGETSTLNNDIVLTSRTFHGNTTFTLPDGTVMTLIGVASINTSFFKV
ncbi:MAG: hypothetical protein WA459_19690 [Stellaceae bacterium]